MCGIAGIYGSMASAARDKAVHALSHGLAHRGPDGKGLYEDRSIALVHTRLSIIDLSEQGNQPLYNEDRSLVLVCNGEIYNYKEIKAELLAKGHTFCSGSDSEVILHLYEEYPNEPGKLLARLTGMFAFALWDINKQKLLLARDRIGIKPLYYSSKGQQLVFSSEVNPIVHTGLFEPRIDCTSLFEYFRLMSIPAPNTFYKGVQCLEPGHYLTIEQGKQTIRKYWDVPIATAKWKNEQEVTDAVEHLLSEVIKDHLVADVPVGTFLSAGVDSSLITAIAAAHHPGIHSFTASFPGEPEDEGEVAGNTAAKLGTTHHAYELKNDFFTDFTTQFQDIDQPFAISSSLSLGSISRLARQYVKVVLSGDGGDELFGGYQRYATPAVPSFLKYIPAALQNSVLKVAAKATNKPGLETLRKNIALHPAVTFLSRTQVADEQTALSFINPALHKEIDTQRYADRLRTLFDSRKADTDPLNRVLYADIKTTLVDEMLTKCDRMTMINGIEGRVPFLDHRMVELAFTIPHIYKRNGNTGKVVLRNILAKKLGHDLAFRVKTGFNSPLQQWLAKDAKTISFVKTQLNEAAALPLLNKKLVGECALQPAAFSATSVYPLVCLNHFCHREDTDTDQQLPS